MKRRSCFLITILFLFCSGVIYADEKLSLTKALEIAYDQNPTVVEARKDTEIAQAQFSISGKWDNPDLEVKVGNLVKDLEGDPSFSTRNIESEISMTQPIDGWGKKGLRERIAEDEYQQKLAEFRSVWLDVVRQVKGQYTQTVLQQKALELAEENLTLHQRFLDQIKVKFDSGEAFNHELSRAKLEVINARNELLSVQKQYKIKKGRLNLLLGRPVHSAYTLVDGFQVESLDGSYEELLQMAIKDRGDVFVQEREVEKKSKELKLAKRERLPSYGLSLFVEREDEIYKGGVGVAFELPIWNFKGNEIKQAKLEKEKAEELLKRLQNEVALEVYTAFHEADLAKKSHDISLEAIQEANEILRFTTLGYEEGEVSFFSYLENIKAYQEAKQSYFESLSQYTINIAELEQVIGKEYENE